MPAPDEVRFRSARESDAKAIAALHADSWQRHYGVAYTDYFLQQKAPGFLLEKWTGRFANPDPRNRTILAEAGGRLIGLAHTVLDDDPTWGALLDNLHVAYDLKGGGVGTRLLSLTAQTVLAERPGSGLYLWVLERNAGARAFYEARGGTCAESRLAEGNPEFLKGAPVGLRYAWPDPARLL
jgi:GNAT superfamily N-acetyltransferase